VAISVPRVLLPDVPDLERWAVIACDQFTGEPEYWEQLTEFVGEQPSALQFILPEVWLADRLDSAPEQIGAAMVQAYDAGQFRPLTGFVLVERTLPSGVKRLGLVADIQLADYEYTPLNTAKIKATEATVPDRLPPRVAIRQAAPLEMPHVLVLIDDPVQQIIERLYHQRDDFELLYDFPLNMGGGQLRGWLIPDDDAEIVSSLLNLERDGLLAVVGDGNHSVAAAKLSGDTRALVELVNIHSPAITFEPIHRVVIGDDADENLVRELKSYLQQRTSNQPTAQTKIYAAGVYAIINIPKNPADAIADIQQFLDEYESSHQIEVDYIHGDDNLINIVNRETANGRNSVAIFLPAIDKNSLFNYAARRGVLPRKSFSIGHAEDKRYYLEMAERH